jgi:tetratricopeptide (TPR) repeat protein
LAEIKVVVVLMRILNIVVCLLILIAICSAQDASTTYDRMGTKLYSSGNYTEALDYFNRSLNQNISNADAWVHKGNALKALRKLNASYECYNRALSFDRNKIAAWSGLADVCTTWKDYANASAAAAQATKLDGKNKAYWLREGNLLQIQGFFRESIPKFDGALKLDAKYKDALYRKALSLVASNNVTQGVILLDQVLTIDPKYKLAYNAKGQIQESQGEYDDALADYNKALELDSKWSLALNNKMHAMLALKKQSDAMNIFIKI